MKKNLFLANLIIIVIFVFFLFTPSALAQTQQCQTDADCPSGWTCEKDPITQLDLCFSTPPEKYQGVSNPVIGNLGTNDASTSSGGKFVQYTVYLWRSAITIGSLAVIVYFLLGAFTWITSGGDKTKVEDARNKITNAIIGLVLLVSSFVLLSFLSKILFAGEFDLLQLSIPGVN